MRRLAPLLFLAGLVLAACGSAATEVASAPTEAPTTVAPATTEAPVDEAAADEIAETTTTTAAPPLPTGREAIAAAEGEPLVLWFWGAH